MLKKTGLKSNNQAMKFMKCGKKLAKLRYLKKLARIFKLAPMNKL
jgi:hypothetical protein